MTSASLCFNYIVEYGFNWWRKLEYMEKTTWPAISLWWQTIT